MLVVGTLQDRRHAHWGRASSSPVLPQTLSKKPRGEGQLPFEQRGNDNLDRANHSDEYKHKQ
jgi:hypothetical protein